MAMCQIHRWQLNLLGICDFSLEDVVNAYVYVLKACTYKHFACNVAKEPTFYIYPKLWIDVFDYRIAGRAVWDKAFKSLTIPDQLFHGPQSCAKRLLVQFVQCGADIGLRNDEFINIDVDQPIDISFAVIGVGRVFTLTNLMFDWALSAQFFPMCIVALMNSNFWVCFE